MAEPDKLPQFTDAKGRVWKLFLSVQSIKDVLRSESNLHLLNDLESGKLHDALADPVTLVDVLWAVLESEATKKAIDLPDFCESITPEVWDEAAIAFDEALVNFSRPVKRPAIQAWIKARKRYQTEAAELIAAKIEKLADEAIGSLKTNLQNGLAGNSASASPESAESSLGGTHSES